MKKSAHGLLRGRPRGLDDMEDEVRLAVHVQPRARAEGIVGVVGDVLKVRLTAPPVKGAANAALIAFLAEALDVPQAAIRIITGSTSRHKVVGIRGVSAELVRRTLFPRAV
jgi:uncharacterized protein